MADDAGANEIRQKMELDASQVLNALTSLDNAFVQFGNRLGATVRQFTGFNQSAGRVVSGLKQMATQADLTYASFAKLSTTPTAAAPSVGATGGQATQAAQATVSFQALTAAITQATQALNGFGTTAGATIPKANANTKGLLISWQTFSRVIVTQFIVRALSMVRDAFKESIASALEFSKSVGEIRAIDPGRSFQQITADVRAMSDAFNQPLSRVVEAQYQTLSDGFTTAADRANILTAANALAKVSSQDLADSSMLLTGALNAYGETSEMAGLRAAQFDKAIEIGRLRMGELGTAMGRVQSIAYQVGVSMEELEASLTTITIGGVKASEAATQIRGVMTGLLKPSEGMKIALREIGVESGEAAIATYGFQGTLEKLQNSVGGSASAMAKLFQNVRGLSGALRLASSGAQTYEQHLAELFGVDQTTLKKKVTEFTATDAEKLTAELNKLKNFWTAEFGMEMVHRLNQIVQLIGGGNGMVGVLRRVTTELPLVAAGIAAMTLAAYKFGAAGDRAFTSLQGNMGRFNLGLEGGISKIATLRNAIGLLAAVELARGLGAQVGGIIDNYLSAPYDAERAATAQSLEARKQYAAAAVREEERKNKEMMKGLRQYVADANRSYLEDSENFKKLMKIEEAVNKMALDRIMQARNQMTRELYSISEAAAKKAQEDIPRTIAELEQTRADRIFREETEEKRKPSDRFTAYQQRFDQEVRLAHELQSLAKDANQEREAERAWSRAEAAKKSADEIAKQTRNAGQLVSSEQMIDKLERTRIDALQRQQKLQQQIADETEKRAQVAERHNLDLEEMRKEIEEKLKTTARGDQGLVKFKSAEELQKDLNDASILIEKFVKQVQASNKADFATAIVGDRRAFAALQREAERAIASSDLTRLQEAPENIANLYKQLQGRLEALKLRAPVIAEIEDVTGMDIVKDGLNAVLDEYEKRWNEISARGAKQPHLTASLMDAATQFDVNIKKAQASISQARPSADVDALLKEFLQIRYASEMTDEQLRGLIEKIRSVDIKKEFSFWDKASVVRFQEDMNSMLDALIKMKMLQKEIKENKAPTGEEASPFKGIEQQIEPMGRLLEIEKKLKEAPMETTDETENQTSALEQTITAVGKLASQWFGVSDQIASATRAVNSLAWASESATPGNAMTAAVGGLAYFAKGGKGRDVIPAMLSPGEFVMNAASARRFASQLVAMNAGVKPVFRNEGGSVTNIGDINVTVSGGGSSHQTARSIAVALKRELRRGTSTL